MVLKHRAIFRFLDLPPEIRNRIYHYSMCCLKGQILVTDIRMQRWRIGHSRREFRWDYDQVAEACKRARKLQRAVLSFFGICRQVYYEAITALYGTNVIVASTFNSARKFLERISPYVRVIQHVKIGFVASSLMAAEVARLLQHVPALKILHLDVDLSAAVVARHFKPLLTYYKQQGRGQKEVLSILKFHDKVECDLCEDSKLEQALDNNSTFVSPCVCASIQAEHDQYRNKVIKLLN